MVEANAKLDRMKQIIYKAIKQHSKKSIQEILNKGFNINTPIMSMNVTSLHLCASMGNAECMKTILEANPDPGQTDSMGRNCIHFACKAGNLETFKLLIA